MDHRKVILKRFSIGSVHSQLIRYYYDEISFTSYTLAVIVLLNRHPLYVARVSLDGNQRSFLRFNAWNQILTYLLTVSFFSYGVFFSLDFRRVLIVVQKIRHGHRWRMVYSFALIVRQFIETWVFIWHLFVPQIWTRIGHGSNYDKCNLVAMQMQPNSSVNIIAIQPMLNKSTIHVPPHCIAKNWAI